jgi:hypothetical protein
MNQDEPAIEDNRHLVELLTLLDEFLRCRDLPIIGLLAESLAARDSNHPGFDTCNLIDSLSFTAHRYRQLADYPPP